MTSDPSTDPLHLDGTAVTATATLSTAPSSTQITSTSATATYTGIKGVKLATLGCEASPGVTVQITDNIGAADVVDISGCSILGLATVTATATIPDGNLATIVPATIPATSLISGTVNYTLTSSGVTGMFNLINGTIVATGSAPPAITPSPLSWTPSVPLGSTIPLSQTINLSASAAVSFTTGASTTSGGSWLSVSPAEANTSSSLTIVANPSGLTTGTYNGVVTLTVQPGVTPIQIPVTLSVAGPSISLTAPSSMSFGYTIGTTAPASQTLSIGSSPASSTSVSASVTSGNSWLSVSPATGTTPANFTVSVNTTGLTAQTLNGNVQITASGVANSPLNVPVTFVVSPSTLTVPSTPLTFNYTIGGAAPTAQPVSIAGTSGISFTTNATTISGGSWLSATPSGGTVPSPVNVAVITTGLTVAGTYTGTVTVTSVGATGSPAPIPVTLNVLAPTLTALPTQLNFSYQLGSSQPAGQSISVGDSSNVNFTATTSGGSWLSVTPGSGSASGSVNVSVDTTGLTAKIYNGTVTIAATGATSQVVNVSLTVTQPSLTVGTSSLNYAFQLGGSNPPSQAVTIGGTAGLSFTATAAGGSWLSVTPGSGTTPNSVSISVDPTSLAAKTYNGSVTIAAPGATSQVVNVTLVVSSSPTISASPSSLNFSYTLGASTPASQPVAIGGTSGLSYTATAAGGSWLSVSPGSGTTPGSVSVSIDTTGLTATTYNGTITIASSGVTSQVVNVTLVVSSAPTITATPSSLTFNYTIGGTTPGARSLGIGGSPVSFTAAAGAAWLSVTPGSGTAPTSVSVSLNPAGLTGLTAATYQTSVTITSKSASNSPLTVPVTVVITGTAPTLTVNPLTLTFTAVSLGPLPADQTVDITSTATTTVAVSTAGGSWLTAHLTTTSTPAAITVSANQANLPPGTYHGQVIVTSPSASNTPQGIPVVLTVAAPTNISATPGSLSFAFVLAGTVPAPQSISVTSNAAASINTSVLNGSWLTVTSSDTKTPATLTASVNPGSLATGTYHATITVTSADASNSPVLLPVTLVISNKPTLAPSPSSLTFTAPSGGPNPATQTINLAGSAPLSFTIATSPSWLSVSAASSTTPAVLVASVNTNTMAQGTYPGAITITSAAAGNSPVAIPVTLVISGPLVSPGPTISAVVSGASYESSGFSAGTIATIFGDLLGPDTGSSFSVNSKGGVDDTLGGVTVTVGGTRAIPLFVQKGQVNIILPYNLATSGQAKVEVQYNNLTSPEFGIPLTGADVQIFTANASGEGPGSILDPGYSVNTAKNPAAKGSVVMIYGTGGGALTPAVTVGGVAGDTLSWVTLPYSATVNGEDAPVLYAGTAPGLVFGVYQFNVRLPADSPSGAVKIVLKVGSSSSQPDVTVFVK